MPTAGELRLEQAHQRDLATIGGGVTSAVANIALGADPAAISTWFFTAVDSIMARVQTGYAQSRRSGSEYMRAKATMAGADVDLRAGSLVTDQARTSLEVTGPVAFKTAVRAGANDEEALLSMATQMSGSAQRLALAGDRDVLEQTIARGKGVLGYRRVLGGPGCGFCAMLASRGAVYLSRESASTSRSGLRFHDHCRCHVEPMFRHKPDPPDVQRLKRQWQRVTAGKSNDAARSAWRNYWEQPAVDRSQLRLAASKAGPPSPVPGPPVPAPGVVVRSALDAKRTLSGLEMAWQAEAKRITGRDLAVSIPAGTSLQTAKEYAEGVLRGLERFPDASLRRVGFGQMARDHYAEAGARDITFNQRWANMANRPALLSGMQDDIAGWSQGRNGWGVRGGGNPMATAVHEFGHVIDIGNLGETIHSRALTLATRRAALEGIPVDDLIAREISVYATASEHELIAEAFADVMLRGQAASPLSKDIFDLLEAEYFKAGGRITPAFGTFPAKAAPNLAKMTVADLRALAAERGVTLPAKALKADIVRALEETPAPITRTPVAGRMTAAEFDTRAAAAAQGRRVEGMPQVRIEIDASAGSDTSKWRAVEARGLSGSPSAVLSAATRRVRSSGPFNTRLRFPEGRPLADWEIKLRAGYSPEMRAQLERADAERLAKEAATADRDIKALDRAMEQSPLPSDVIVWRGGPASDIRLPAGDVIGHEWVDPGYLGTSAARSVSEHSFAGGQQGVLMRILAPEGTPAIGIAGGGEAELLLGRGLRYRVVADRGRTSAGARILDVEIVPKATAAEVPSGAARWLGNVDLPAAEAERIGQLVQAKSRRDILDEIAQLRADGASNRALANRIRGRAALPNTYDVAPQVDDAFRDELLTAVDNGTIDDVVRRHLAALDVPVAAEKPLAKRTVAELRALAKERQITLPPKATKAQIVEELQKPPLAAAEKAAAERKAIREAARERNRQIEQATGTARLLAEVDELLAKKATAATIRQRLDPALIRAEQVFANADPAVREALAAAVASGDMAKVRAAVTRLSTKAKLKVVGGKAGAKVKFDPDTMETLGAEIADGAPVTVVTRGASVTLPDGSVVQVGKAQVTPVAPASKPITKPLTKRELQILEAKRDIPVLEARLKALPIGDPARADVQRRLDDARAIIDQKPGPSRYNWSSPSWDQPGGSRILRPPTQAELSAHVDSRISTAVRGQTRTDVVQELDRQAELTPRSMLEFRGVEDPARFDLTNHANSYAYYDHSFRQVSIKPDWEARRADLERSYASDIATNWHPPTSRTGLEAITAHEYGHHVTYRLIEASLVEQRRLIKLLDETFKLDGYLVRQFRLGPDIEKVITDFVSGPYGLGRVDRYVSRYAQKNYQEFFAEVWSEYTTMGDQARPQVKAIGDMMRRMAELSDVVSKP